MTRTKAELTVGRAGDPDSRVRLITAQERVGAILKERRPSPDWAGPIAGSAASRRTASLGLVENPIAPSAAISPDTIRQGIGLEPVPETDAASPDSPPELPDLVA